MCVSVVHWFFSNISHYWYDSVICLYNIKWLYVTEFILCSILSYILFGHSLFFFIIHLNFDIFNLCLKIGIKLFFMHTKLLVIFFSIQRAGQNVVRIIMTRNLDSKHLRPRTRDLYETIPQKVFHWGCRQNKNNIWKINSIKKSKKK